MYFLDTHKTIFNKTDLSASKTWPFVNKISAYKWIKKDRSRTTKKPTLFLQISNSIAKKVFWPWNNFYTCFFKHNELYKHKKYK